MANEIRITIDTKGISAKLKKIARLPSQMNTEIKDLVEEGFSIALSQADYSRDTGALMAGIASREKKEGRTTVRYSLVSRTPIPIRSDRSIGVKYNEMINYNRVSADWGKKGTNPNYPNSRKSIGFMERAREHIRNGAIRIRKSYVNKIKTI